MRQKEIALNIRPIKPIGMDDDDDHPISSYDTPLREDAFTLSDDDSWFLFALQGRRTVKDVLKSLEISEDRLLSHIPRIRRLGKLGAIDFVDDALL